MSDITKRAIFNEKWESYTTPAGIITFAAVAKKWKQKDAKPGDDGAYILTLITPPDHDLKVLRDGCDALAKQKLGKTRGIGSPFSDAAEKLDPERMPVGFNPAGWTMIRSNTYQKRPGVIFANGEQVPEDELLDEVYNGRWARMTVKPHAYPAKDGGKAGVKLYLSNIQLLKKGEPWPGGMTRVDAHEEFDAIDLDEDDSADAVFDKPAGNKGKPAAGKGKPIQDDDIPF